MISKFVQHLEPVALVGGAPVSDALLRRARHFAPFGGGADGGAVQMLRLGWVPEFVIGDMDSLGAEARGAVPPERLCEVSEQDSTDFEKCLMRIDAPLLVAAGFRGGRLDHELAALHALVRFCERRCVLLGEDEIVFLCPPRCRLTLPVGAPLSLFPLGPVTGRSAGLEWSFEALDYAPGARIGTSNRVTGPVELEMSAPAMLCILASDALDEVLRQLTGPAAPHWPARA